MARMFGITGSYVVPFIICAGVAVFAAAILIPVKPVYWLELRERVKAGKPASAVS
jgi:hypothetical protein